MALSVQDNMAMRDEERFSPIGTILAVAAAAVWAVGPALMALAAGVLLWR